MNAKLLLCLALVLSGGLFAASTVAQQNQLLAFPGAEGFGQFATGGTGGEIFYVTTLDDSGTNSFRDAVSQPHRIIVFDVGGVIQLQSNLSVSSDLTIQGQTAPGEGITLYGRSVSFSGEHNDIVRYLRFREGKLDAARALAAGGALPEDVNYAVKSSFLLSFLESVPDVANKLKAVNTADEKFSDAVKSAQDATVLVLVY